MKKFFNHFVLSYKELVEKVTWSTWNELQQSTILVLVAVIIFTAIVWIFDLGSSTGLKFFYKSI